MKYRAMLRAMPFVVGSVIKPAMSGDSEEGYREPPVIDDGIPHWLMPGARRRSAQGELP